MIRVEPYDWINLRYQLPDRFHRIVDLCFEMEKIFKKIDRFGIRFITEDRLSMIIRNSQRILFEYMSLLQPRHEEVKEDLRKEYEMMFMGGRESFLWRYVTADPSKKQSYLGAFLLQFHSFIHFRIFDPLSQVVMSGKEAREKFIKEALARTGIFERMGEEEEEFKFKKF